MTINETIFSLLREALFGQEVEIVDEQDRQFSIDENEKLKFWNNVYLEAQKQAVIGIIAPVIKDHIEIPEQLRKKWSGMQKPFAIRYVQMAAGQAETCTLLQKAGIKAAVMKGTAAAIYYPVPEYRAMGDVDLLVGPKNYKVAVALLKSNGYTLYEEGGQGEFDYHTAFLKYNILYEVHRLPSGIHRSEKGNEVAKYILSGLKRVEINIIGEDQFPILPWKQNGMELIWHIRQHLYNGLGLRQIVDWMMFVNCMLDDKQMREYMPALENCGLDQLAIVVTKMCQKYLGLTCERITWCDGADESLCDELMQFIMNQGNFGVKAMDEKTAKVLSGYSNPRIMLRKLQEVGKTEWKLLKKYPVLTPFAFIYGVYSGMQSILGGDGGLKKIIEDLRIGKKRKKMFLRLYGRKNGKKG